MLIIIIFIKVSISFKLIIFIKAILITVGHFFTDEIKSLIILYKSKYRNNIWLFITDQISHFLIIALVILGLNNLIKVYQYNLDNTNKLLIALIVFLVVTIVTGIFIKIFINDLMPEKALLMPLMQYLIAQLPMEQKWRLYHWYLRKDIDFHKYVNRLLFNNRLYLNS